VLFDNSLQGHFLLVPDIGRYLILALKAKFKTLLVLSVESATLALLVLWQHGHLCGAGGCELNQLSSQEILLKRCIGWLSPWNR
jgi:hypothetical protein